MRLSLIHPFRKVVTGLAAALVAAAAFAEVIHVDDDAPNDPGPGTPHISDPLEDGSLAHPFDALAEAIGVAVDGDEIEIAAGTYQGIGNARLDTDGKSITIRSASGPQDCVIDLDRLPDDPNFNMYRPNDNWAFEFHRGEQRDTVVDGLTIRDGLCAEEARAVIECYGASPSVRNCLFLNNDWYSVPHGGEGPGSLYLSGGAALFENCLFEDSTTENQFGVPAVASLYDSDAVFRNCVFRYNRSETGPTIGIRSGNPTIEGCVFIRNDCNRADGVIDAYASRVRIDRCTFAENLLALDDESAVVSDGLTGLTIVTNSIFVSNFAPAGRLGPGIFRYCITESDQPGIGNVTADPRLTRDRFHVRADSPAVGAGDPNAPGGGFDLDGDPIPPGAPTIGADQFVDTDADGMSDWFERRYFGDEISADPNADPDADGRRNLAEYEQAASPLHAARRTYVAVDGDDAWDGLAPEWDGEHGPLATLTAALALADEQEPGEIILTDGVFSGAGFQDVALNRKPLSIRSLNGRDASIIDAGGATYALHTPPGVFDTTIREMTIRAAQSAVYCRESLLRIEQCRFVGEGPGVPDRTGIWADAAILFVTDCEFFDHRPRGMLASQSAVRVSGCTFSNNGLNGPGAGLFAGTSSLDLSDCLFSGNRGGDGGGLRVSGGNSTLSDCMFVGNTAETGGALSVSGPAVGRNLVFIGNVAADHGGGMHAASAPADFSNCLFVDNSAFRGGAAHLGEGPARIVSCVVAGNTADRGGGLFLVLGGMAINTLIVANTASDVGGGVFAADGMLSRVLDCTIAGNAARAGGGLAAAGAVNVRNAILFGNVASEQADEVFATGPRGSVSLRDCLVAPGGRAMRADAGGSIDVDVTVVRADPQFRDATGPDGDALTWEDNDYRLAAGSPAIDAGSVDSLPDDHADLDGDGNHAEKTPRDLDGNRRIADCAVDMGAFESPYETPIFDDADNDGIPDECRCAADLDGNGGVDIVDLTDLLRAYGTPSGASHEDGDVDGDGDVDLSDLSALLAEYGRRCLG